MKLSNLQYNPVSILGTQGDSFLEVASSEPCKTDKKYGYTRLPVADNTHRQHIMAAELGLSHFK